MRKILGGFIFLMGLVLGAWMFYNLVIQRLPETEGRNPIPPLVLCGAMLFVGIKWMKGEQAG